MQLFYTPAITGTEYTLPEEESRHCIRVLRLTANDPLLLVDGKGNLYHCRITHPDPRACRVSCMEKTEHYGQHPYSLHIAIAPTKNMDRFEWFLEKCTEIGIDEITPLLCHHSERKTIHPERLEKIMISAMKQSVKAYLPVLHPLIPSETFILQHTNSLKCIAHCEEGAKKGIAEIYAPGQNATILIGPEGDFSPEEIGLALKNNFLPVTLGSSRLRTETAGIVACHSFHFINESGVQ